MEFSCEGKTYPWMNRVAVRYKDRGIVADEICPKYETRGLAARCVLHHEWCQLGEVSSLESGNRTDRESS